MKQTAVLVLILSCFFLENPRAEALTIHSKISRGPWKKVSAIYPMKGEKVLLKVPKITSGKIRWYRIIPDISKIYKNANHPWEKNPYKWVGFGKIDYFREEMEGLRGQWEIEPFGEDASGGIYDSLMSMIYPKKATPMKSRFYNRDMGSFWFQAVVERNGKKLRSPGLEQSDNRGISPGVFRVSVRGKEGYLGYLTSFFNVPGLFGSIPYQSGNYIGVDCADVLFAALCKWRKKPVKKDYNVAMLVRKYPKVAEFDLEDGVPSKRVRWKSDVRPGDFIAVRYSGRRQYQHIGALYKDANKNNVLDSFDMVIHAGPYPLQLSRLSEGPFDGHVVILRPR